MNGLFLVDLRTFLHIKEFVIDLFIVSGDVAVDFLLT